MLSLLHSHIFLIFGKTKNFEDFIGRNLQDELNDARNRILERNEVFIKEMAEKFAQSEENIKRRIEDSES